MRIKPRQLLDSALVVLAVIASGFTIASRIQAAAQGRDAADPLDVAEWQSELSFDRIFGSEHGAYRLVVWTDYQCPACRHLEGQLESVRQSLADSLTIVYRYFPLARHSLAVSAAVAAECGRMQGRFAPLHEALFEALAQPGDSLQYSTLLAASGIADWAEFQDCLTETTAFTAVQVDLARGRELGIRSTPTLQIGSRLALGSRLAEELLPMLRAAGHFAPVDRAPTTGNW